MRAAKAQGGAKRRFALRLVVALAALPFTAGIILAGLFVAASRGPIELPFLADRLASTLQYQLGSGPVSFGRTVLSRSENALSVRVENLNIRNPDGAPGLFSPDAEVVFNATQFARLSFSPQGLSLNQVTIAPPSSVAKVSNEAQSGRTIGGTLGGLIGFLAERSYAGLPVDLEIKDSQFDIQHPVSGQTRRLANVNLRISNPRKGQMALAGSAVMDGISVPLAATVSRSDNGFDVVAEAGPINGDQLPALLGLQPQVTATGGTAFKLMRAKLAPNGTVQRAEAELSLLDAKVTAAPALREPTFFKSVAAKAIWDVSNARIEQLRVSLDGEGMKADLAGPATISSTTAPAYVWTPKGQIEFTGGNTAKSVTDVETHVEITSDFDNIKVQDLRLSGHGGLAVINTRLEQRQDGAEVSGDLKVERMPAAVVLQYWPIAIGTALRQYFATAIKSGDVRQLTGKFALTPQLLTRISRSESLPADAFQFAATLDNVDFLPGPGLPRITGLSLKAEANSLEAKGTVTQANLLVTDKPLSLSDASFQITRLDTWTPQATIRARTIGPLETVADWLRQPRNRDRIPAAIDLASLRGQVDGRFQLAFQIGEVARAAEPMLSGDARLTNVSLDKIAGGEKLQNGVFQLKLQNNIMSLKGDVQWRQIPATISIDQDARTKALSTSAVLKLDDATLKRLGFTGGISTRTALPVTLRGLGSDGRAVVEADLSAAEIDDLVPGLKKAAGRPASVKFAVSNRGTGYALQDFAFDAGTARLRGQLEVRADGSLQSAQLSQFHLSNGDAARLDFDASSTGNKAIIRGANFDARPFLQKGMGRSGNRQPGQADFELDLQTTLLSGYGGQVITSAALKTSGREGALRALSLEGKLNGQKVSISGRADRSDRLPLTLDIDDAGAFLKYMDLYTRMAGGKMEGAITVMRSPGGPPRLNGRVLVNDFSLVNEPAIRRMTQQAQTEARRGSGPQNQTKFSKLRAEFARQGSNITLNEAVLFGSEVGLTMAGQFDAVADRVAMTGTYIPAYGLNNAFGQIPIVGTLLSGGRNQGLLGITFQVGGRFSQPNVTINPLSAVAPGIFRRIFEFKPQTEPDQKEPAAVGSTGSAN